MSDAIVLAHIGSCRLEAHASPGRLGLAMVSELVSSKSIGLTLMGDDLERFRGLMRKVLRMTREAP